MAQNKSAPRLMTLQAAASELGIAYTSVRDLVLRGHLKRVQLGDSRRIWIERAELERLISRSTAQASQ
jgi:excisionase family DNA binding protein